MKIRMLVDQPVAPDGINVQLWKAGSVHELADAHAQSMIAAKFAERHDGPSEAKVVEPEEPARRKR